MTCPHQVCQQKYHYQGKAGINQAETTQSRQFIVGEDFGSQGPVNVRDRCEVDRILKNGGQL